MCVSLDTDLVLCFLEHALDNFHANKAIVGNRFLGASLAKISKVPAAADRIFNCFRLFVDWCF